MSRQNRLSVGRGYDVDIFVDSKSVSKKHLEIVVMDRQQVRLIDRGSMNHTFLVKKIGRRRIVDEVVDRYSRIELGNYQTTPDELLKQYQPSGPTPKESSGKIKPSRFLRGTNGEWRQA